MEKITYKPGLQQDGASNALYQDISNILGKHKADASTASSIGARLMEQYKEFDDKYISALLFPEDSEAARIPTKFPLATANATQTFSFYVSTGNQGCGYVSVLPLDLSFCMAYQSRPEFDGNPQDSGALKHSYLNDTNCYQILDFYAQGRVVGCSVRAQYIGEAMTESGLMVGAHVYDSTLGRISENVVENGYYISRGRPHEGIRLAYLPRDDGDLEYTALDYRVKSAELPDSEGHFVASPGADYGYGHNLQTGTLSLEFKNPETQDWRVDAGRDSNMSGNAYFTRRLDQCIGQTQKRFQSNTPYQMVVYWVGMPVDRKWIRIDITRHLELVPRLVLRDLISVKKADPDDGTMKAICRVAEVDARPLSNTLKRHEDAVASNANTEMTGESLLNKSVRSKGTGNWLSKIWSGLKSAAGIVAPMLGMLPSPYTKLAGAGLGMIAGANQPSNQSDAYVGSVTQGIPYVSQQGRF